MSKALSRLKEQYQNEIIDAMIKKFGYKNIMEVPKLDKVVINMGVGEAKDNAKALDSAVADMEKITGQKAVLTRAKNSVANFKIREGMAIGCKVTLRGEKMYEFVDRLINLALPRVRDFRGVNPNAFDGRGNYALGIKEQLIFPEIEYDKVDKVRGMDVIFVTTANTDEEARELLTQFNMPFTMTMSDPIADMLTRIRNANTAKHDTVDVPASKMKIAIADILVNEGYITKYDIVEEGNFNTIRITLKYGADKNEKVISGIKKISKPGLRVYAGKDELPRVLGGLGTAIISTNQGVITDKEARKLGVGGEVLCFVW